MKIIVIGDGKVGYTLTEQLSKEGHDIVVIDKNPQALRQSVDVLDVMGIQGNGASLDVLREAGAERADLVIAATSSDETNLLACITAKKMGADHTIARVEVLGGCNGNLKGISQLLVGMKAEDAIARMEGTTCGNKPTSCPDQIAHALKGALAEL